MKITKAPWPPGSAERVVEIFSRHTDYQSAFAEVCRDVRECTPASMKELLRRCGRRSPREYLRIVRGSNHPGIPESSPPPAPPTPVYAAPVAGLDFDEDAETRRTDPIPPPPEARPSRHASPTVNHDDVRRLVELTRREPVAFEELCDELDMSPSKARALVDRARADGFHVDVAHGQVGYRPPEANQRIQPVGIAPIIGERQTIGIISDTHLGSRYCLREQLRDFVHHAYAEGAREILHPGDVLDGMYKHGIWELTHSGIDEQCRDLFETLPQLPGLNYRAISGNHDFTFSEGSGLDVGRHIEGYFRAYGRDDLHFYGDRSAYLRVGGAVFHLWHPKKGCGYARSYALQKQVESYASGYKPHVLLVGHWHVFAHVFERGVHALACPTFQGGGSAFSKSLGGAPAIGGTLVRFDMTEHGTMRNFVHEYRAYFEVERPHNVENESELREEMAIS